MKKVISLVMALVMMMAIMVPAFAAEHSQVLQQFRQIHLQLQVTVLTQLLTLQQ